jgi:hypothetical protein
METGRPSPFRFERTTKEILETYLEDAWSNNAPSYLHFHQAREWKGVRGWLRPLGPDIRQAIRDKEQLLEHAVRYPIWFVPDRLDMLRVVIHPKEGCRGEFEKVDYDRDETDGDPAKQIEIYRLQLANKTAWLELLIGKPKI